MVQGQNNIALKQKPSISPVICNNIEVSQCRRKVIFIEIKNWLTFFQELCP